MTDLSSAEDIKQDRCWFSPRKKRRDALDDRLVKLRASHLHSQYVSLERRETQVLLVADFPRLGVGRDKAISRV